MTSNATDAIAASLVDGFRYADPAFSPCPLWWWSGDTVTAERLAWQMDRFREGGVWNAVMMNLAPAGPLYGHFADDPPFMSDAWWDLVRATCAHAKETGFRLWFYDQIGFSGANIQGRVIAGNGSFAAQTLERVVEVVDSEGAITCPPDGTPLVATARAVGVDDAPNGELAMLPIVDGVARWSGTGRVRLALTYAVRRGFDYFNPDACAALIDTIHGEFARHVGEYFGDVIVGSFQDELPSMPLWGTTFAAAFTEAHGYDPVPLLDGLWEEIGRDTRRLRHDFHATRAALGERAFFKPLFAWHEDRHLLLGVDQQHPARTGDPEGGVRIYADYLKTHRWFSAPGSDHHGEAKIHSSLSHLYGRPRVWIEAFHSSGWGGTLEETFDWLVPWLRAGANLYDPHASYYCTRGGWFEWAPPSTDWRQPYWQHYHVFADAVSRLSWLLTQGRHDCDVAVLYPTATVQSGLGLEASTEAHAAHLAYQALSGVMTWYNVQPGLLDTLGVDYDVVDDDSVAIAAVEDGRLCVAGEAWRTVILPACDVLEPATARVLLGFARAGGTLLALDHAPTRLTVTHEDDLDLVDQLAEFVTVIGAGDLESALMERPLVDAPVPTLVRRVDDATVVFVQGAFPRASNINTTDWLNPQIDFDRARYSGTITVRVRDVTGEPTLWDPFTGTMQAIDPRRVRVDGEVVEVDVPLDGAPCAVLVWGAPPVDASTAIPTGTESVLAQPGDVWAVDLVPTIDNRWGDLALPASADPFPVQQWGFTDGNGERVIATFGPRARVTGPDGETGVASWSLSRGIRKDPIHRHSLGPAGHVPEEFLEFGRREPGESVRIETAFDIPEAFEGWLAIGSAGSKQVHIDGQEVAIDEAENRRYQAMTPVSLRAGAHTLDLTLTARRAGPLRCSVALTTDAAAYRRPDTLTAAGERVPETSVSFATSLTIPSAVATGEIQVATRGPATITLDGIEVGRQGGYLPYGDGSAAHRYDLAPYLSPGEHTLAVTIEDASANPMRLTVDGVVTFEDGGAPLWIMTDPGWQVTREGEALPVALDTLPVSDPALLHLRQRPHPLPGTAWIEGEAADPGTVLPIAWRLPGVAPRDETLSCLVPPGATRAWVPATGFARARLDGADVTGTEGDGVWAIDLPGPERERRELVLAISPLPGFAGGGALRGPVTYEAGPGRMALGNWEDHGLAGYSGIVRYVTEIGQIDRQAEGRIYLDLGDLRGSAAVRIDGNLAGTLVTAPFRVEITEQVRAATGSIRIEIEVANTLGPYIDDVSPTAMVYGGQRVSGLFGPVRIIQIDS